MSIHQTQKQPIHDIAQVAYNFDKLSGLDKKERRELLEIYAQTTLVDLKKLEEAFQTKDYATVNILSHKLRYASEQVHALQLSQQFEQLELRNLHGYAFDEFDMDLTWCFFMEFVDAASDYLKS